MIYGYMRVSTKSQEGERSLDSQKRILGREGAQFFITEAALASGARKQHELEDLIERLKPGDVLLVTKMDRFSRSTLQALEYIKKIQDKGATLRSLDISNSGDSTADALVMQVFLALSQSETARRRERQRLGIERAKKQEGKYPGRKRKISEKEIPELENLVQERKLPMSEIALLYGVSRSTLYRYLKIKKTVEIRREGGKDKRI